MKHLFNFILFSLIILFFAYYSSSVSKVIYDNRNPVIWFQHDDFADTNNDSINEFVRDMLTRWEESSVQQWTRALGNTDVYSFHENLLKVGTPQGMGAKFLELLRRYFNDYSSPDDSLYARYLRLILPVLHRHSIDIVIHTVGSKGDFVPWDMWGKTSNGSDTLFRAEDKGLRLVKKTISQINRVCGQLFSDGYKVRKVKLQSVLSGIWQRGIKNNVYCALEYMKGVQAVYPEIEFYLGDALLQRRDYNNSLNWRNAYDTLY
ncbi:MAG: hypothetical protein N2510_07410, partial [Ignavibacteria bacterium]|nr:hypothetical protein [Ignavibacteria bacterium]